MPSLREKITKSNPNVVFIENFGLMGLDSAIRGYTFNLADKPVLVYDKLAIIATLTKEILEDPEAVEEYKLDYQADLEEDHCEVPAKLVVEYYIEEEYDLTTRNISLGKYTPLIIENPKVNMSPNEIKDWLEGNGDPYTLLKPQFDAALIGIGYRLGGDYFCAVYSANQIQQIASQNDEFISILKELRMDESGPVTVFDF